MQNNKARIKKHVNFLKKGNISAFNEIYNIYSEKLLYFTYGYIHSKDDVENIVQEVFMKIWERRREIDNDLSFESYIFKITFNLILKYYRKSERERNYIKYLYYNSEDEDYKTLNEIEYSSFMELVDKALEKQPARRRSIFKMSRFDNISNKDIASRLNISKRTVENQISKTQEFLRSELKSIIIS